MRKRTNGPHSDEETLVGGLDTSPAKEPLSQKLLYTGHANGNAAPGTTGGGQ